MTQFAKEFKEFAMRGNVVDMAVGVVIGTAFGKIVSSLVSNILTPVIGVIVGGVSFKNLQIVIKEATETAPAVAIQYGIFFQAIFDFIIIALAIFSVMKFMNTLKKKEEEAPAEPAPPPKQEMLLEEIRDLLKK
ncbi:MAG: large-conductance mechanosensitive channel protein MscL [Bdellovibrionales bacterium]|nr:large-conductance mechanosensitive channel protein MscL [Bdellovibrionales bacterium]